jgi:hypothetical protein
MSIQDQDWQTPKLSSEKKSLPDSDLEIAPLLSTTVAIQPYPNAVS